MSEKICEDRLEKDNELRSLLHVAHHLAMVHLGDGDVLGEMARNFLEGLKLRFPRLSASADACEHFDAGCIDPEGLVRIGNDGTFFDSEE